MPGLRSLVARRRCSLPSAQITTGPIICSYPSIPASIASRKGHSLDEIHPGKNTLSDKSSRDDKSKWDLKTLFEIKDEPLSPEQDSNISNENFFCNSTDISSINEIYLNGSENKNNLSMTQCQNDYFDPLEITLKQEIKSECMSQEENGLQNENVDFPKNVSPERIVIKMKLLHGSSLSDVTNISPDTSSDSNESIKSEFCYERTCTPNTQWTIDSILNQPFAENEHSNCSNSNSSNISCKNSQLPNEDLNDQNDKENSYCSTEKNDFFSPVSCDIIDDNSNVKESSNIDLSEAENTIIRHHEKPIIIHQGTDDNIENISQSNEKFIENIRRPSDSSDVSEDSVCSEASIGSSISSDSSVKSCSIVIKRLENSDTYSCFRSPKNKRKRHQGNEFTKAVYLNGKASLPILYIQKRLVYESKSDMLPCSVTLCDIFSNYPFRKENCPKCCRYYNLESDVFVDIYCNTLTLQCLICKWIVVRRLRPKEININKQVE